MKIIPIVLAVVASVPMLPTAVSAQHAYGQSGYSQQCFKEVYREQYHPGTLNSPGRVRSWTEQKEVPCYNDGPVTIQPYPRPRPRPVTQAPVDDNSCVEGSILGGIAGAAGGAALSRDEGLFIGIPLGIVAGSMIGCQIDGG